MATRNEQTFRLQLRLPQSQIDRIERLAEKIEATSMAEVARTALRLLEAVVDAQANGETLCIQKDDELIPIVLLY